MSFEDERPIEPPVKHPGSRLTAGMGPSPIAQVRMLAKEYSEAAIHALVAVMDNPQVEVQARIEAARALLDYAHGQPALKTAATDTLRQLDGVIRTRKRDSTRGLVGEPVQVRFENLISKT